MTDSKEDVVFVTAHGSVGIIKQVDDDQYERLKICQDNVVAKNSTPSEYITQQDPKLCDRMCIDGNLLIENSLGTDTSSELLGLLQTRGISNISDILQYITN